MLKCHVFRCDVPAKAIASALQGLCAQVRACGGQGLWSWDRMDLALYPAFSLLLCASCWLHCVLDLVREGRSQWRSCLLFPRSDFPRRLPKARYGEGLAALQHQAAVVKDGGGKEGRGASWLLSTQSRELEVQLQILLY